MRLPRPLSTEYVIASVGRDIQAAARSSYPSRHTPFVQPFSTSPCLLQKNRIFTPFRTPPQFYDALRLISANNTLLLTLFTTSACTPCRTITPLLTSLIETRPPSPEDKYSHLAFAELELDSPDMSNGKMLDLGVQYAVTSMPTLIGFGGRRAERVTERIVDTRMLSNEGVMAKWIDEEMKKGDPFPGQTGTGGLLSKIFGS
ncbi:hypothetical protein G647_06878 [Cladophialophora carrionii CBS 160.54]|uniref:Thioredoxin domain-containing protein n=1 Tax=Cladophialophora carrionii CBS 160.54 TaxID=1279043 RepID=V9DA19_9EURO|nr:uncharacterized protein G647_06878 [Cladophialophora carrionii CBS 160.54]ETI22802.1 hypothetical protein G647_06878 [Cladophialophora carrionii CBS 160.54]